MKKCTRSFPHSQKGLDFTIANTPEHPGSLLTAPGDAYTMGARPPPSSLFRLSIMSATLVSIALLLLLPASVLAQRVGTLTVVEGDLRVIRNTAVLRVSQGARIDWGDILETGGRGFAQVECDTGAIVALGSASQLFFFSQSGYSGATGGELVLRSGWLKVETTSKVGPYLYDTPLLAGKTKDGTLVLQAGAELSEIFVESGSAGIVELTGGGSGNEFRPAKAGQFFSRNRGKNVAVSPRPAAAFMDAMPTPFRDTLPSGLSHIKGKPPEPRREREVSYADLRPWLLMPARWRRDFVTRFESRLNDPDFRRELESHIRDHPDWEAALHPDKDPSKK